MMSLKVVLVALAAVCAAQAHAVENDASPIQAYAASDIINKIEVVLDIVRAQIKIIDQQLKIAIDAAYEKVQEVVEKQGKVWHEAVAEAMKQADKYGVDVSDCIAESATLTEVVDNLLANSRQCVANESPAFATVQKKADDLLNQTNSLLETAKSMAQDCETKPIVEEAICSTRHLVPLLVEATKLGASAAKVSVEISAISAKITAKIGACVGIVSAAETKHAMQIVDKVNKCILNKIKGVRPHAL